MVRSSRDHCDGFKDLNVHNLSSYQRLIIFLCLEVYTADRNAGNGIIKYNDQLSQLRMIVIEINCDYTNCARALIRTQSMLKLCPFDSLKNDARHVII